MLKFTSSRFHSSLRLAALEVLKSSNTKSQADFIVTQQKKVLDQLGVVQHHDSITGTATKRAAEDYFSRVQTALVETENMNVKVIGSQLEQEHGIKINKIDSSLMQRTVNNKSFSPYQFSKEYLIIAQNPSA